MKRKQKKKDDKDVWLNKYDKLVKSMHSRLNTLRQIEYWVKSEQFREAFIASKGKLKFTDVVIPDYKISQIKFEIEKFRFNNLDYKDFSSCELRKVAKDRGLKYISSLTSMQIIEILERKDRKKKEQTND